MFHINLHVCYAFAGTFVFHFFVDNIWRWSIEILRTVTLQKVFRKLFVSWEIIVLPISRNIEVYGLTLVKRSRCWEGSDIKCSKYQEWVPVVCVNIFKGKRKQKYSCFWKCGWRKESSLGRPQIYFFNQFNWTFKIIFTTKKLL